jgi:hypothetical protein
MKRDIVKYVERCMTCLQVKAEHQKPYENFQPLEIPMCHTPMWGHDLADNS